MNELLLHTELTKEQRELTKASMESSQALLNIIADLQELAQVESGDVGRNLVPTSVPEIIREACAACAESARRKHLFLNIDVDPMIPSVVLADRTALQRVLSKLLLNAVITTIKGGIVLCATCENNTPQSSTIRFSVKDTGIGLTEEEQQRLFLPFGGEQAWTPSYGGTGLGLYLCKRIVDTIGGALTVESKKGSGSDFQFALTFEIPDAASTSAMIEERRQVLDDQATSGNRPYTPPPSMDR
jgi:signal transduction histidine kinase